MTVTRLDPFGVDCTACLARAGQPCRNLRSSQRQPIKSAHWCRRNRAAVARSRKLAQR